MKPVLLTSVCAAALVVCTPSGARADDGAITAAVAEAKQTFTLADFARFSPRTAYDMIVQIPSFTLRGADGERGLGQASENVLINGQRIANKSGGAIDELTRIRASDVERIELTDAATLGIAGLSGQVANVVVKSKRAGGQFEWNPAVRPHYAKPNLFGGSISYSDSLGKLDYTLSVKDEAGRGGFGGPVLIGNPDGTLRERQDQVFHSEWDMVTVQTKLSWQGPGKAQTNLTLGYSPYWGPFHITERRIRADGDNRSRLIESTNSGYTADVSGDMTIPLGGGKLKLIGLHHYDHEPIITTQTTRFDSGAPDSGFRFISDSFITETVGRAEYSWRSGKTDWQLSLERAYNARDQRGSLFELDAGGEFQPVPLPGGSGKVTETRYEAIGSLSRPLSGKLDLQVAMGGEVSTLRRVDGDLPPRHFFRPKGSVTLGWRPSPKWDVSLKLNRRVGQISFGDFLAQPNLQLDREQSGNPDLVPPQSWELEAEAGRSLGAWGKARLKVYGHAITDLVDIIPIGTDGQAVGNLPHATRLGAELTGTLQLDPIGWKGAKIDIEIEREHTRVRDPLTGVMRPFGGAELFEIEVALRHDIPRSNLAWGVNASHQARATDVYLDELYYNNEGPVFANAFIEHKNLFGLTVRATVINLLNARHIVDRTVYTGRRNVSPVDFRQSADQLIGPIFRLSVKGTF